MANIKIIRGDSYASRRPLYTYTITDVNGGPFNLAGSTIRTTYKTQILPVEADPEDATALIKHTLSVDLSGVATGSGLVLVGPASAGVVQERLSSAETRLLEANKVYISDLKITDTNNETITFTFEDGILPVDSVTNRTA